MSGVFETASKKIYNLLGMTALGQKTKATALGVTLCSDEDAIKVTDNAGSLTIDSPGIPTTLGQKTKAASLGVTLASDEDAIKVTDNAGSLTVDSPGIPTTLGQKTMANSLGVVVASDQSGVPVTLPTGIGPQAIASSISVVQADLEIFDVNSAVKNGWVIFSGNATLLADAWDGDKGSAAGGSFNVYAVRATEGAGVAVDTLAEIQQYFKGDHASFNGDPIWFFIPLVAEGYKNFWINVKNELGVSMDVTIYGALDNGLLFSTGAGKQQVTGNIGSVQIATATIATANVNNFGNGGSTQSTQCQWPFNYLIVKADPVSDPSTGYWSMSIVLSA